MVVLWGQRQRDIEFGKSEKKMAWACSRVLRGHSADVYEVAWSSDSKYLVSCSLDGSAILFSADKGKAIQRLEGHKKTVQGCIIDPMMKYILTLSADRTVRVYKATKGKSQLQFYLHHILKYRDYAPADPSKDPPAAPENKDVPMTGAQPEDDDSLSSLEQHGKRSHLMFADEAECPAFQRRAAWSPDGSFLLLPAGIFKKGPGERPFFAVYGFTRKNIHQPAFHLPGFEKCPTVVRFCPYLFAKDPTVPRNQELIDLPYMMVFAIASLDVVAIYNTQSINPMAVVRNVHYHSITDLTFSKDKYLLISSSDGYCSIVRFSDNVLGMRLPAAQIPHSLQPLFQDYDKIDVNDTSQFAKNTPAAVTSTLRLHITSPSCGNSEEREEQGGAADPGDGRSAGKGTAPDGRQVCAAHRAHDDLWGT